jgi:hypothetical protein
MCAKPSLATCFLMLAIAVVTLLLMVNGGTWLLEESPAAADELIDSGYGESAPAGVCTAADLNDDKGKAL